VQVLTHIILKKHILVKCDGDDSHAEIVNEGIWHISTDD
jgi:hypothetical protein